MNTTDSCTAFFYRQPVVLDRLQHKALRVTTGNALFAAHCQAVPLMADEFAQACLEYPIVFLRGQQPLWLAVALTGLKDKTNAFVDAQGRWLGRHVPASVQRYPFILAGGEPQALSLAADLAAPQLGDQGQPLFDEAGEPTELTRSILQQQLQFQSRAHATADLASRLEAAGLLVQKDLQVSLADGRKATVKGVWVLDDMLLRNLPQDQAMPWLRSGELALLHAQLLSLRNLPPLLERSQAPLTAKPVRAPRKSRKTSASRASDPAVCEPVTPVAPAAPL